MENSSLIHTTHGAPDVQKDVWSAFNKMLPSVQWIVTGIIAVSVAFIGFRDSQTSQAQLIRDIQKDQENLTRQVQINKNEREKQLEDLKSKIISRELFDERTKSIMDEQLRQRQILERILEQNRRGAPAQ